MSYATSFKNDSKKVFLVRHSELERRLDPFCYIPELVELDNKIKDKTKYRLKDFAISYAGGATPKKEIAENYATKEDGIPFIRVQNLSITGELKLNDLVYISKHTHNNLLKRSKINEYDLLVKITGVGRMAVASVAPSGFKGNINQHIVVIRTGSKEISENIAAFLNLDSTEKLASKRATGGTRPALDYTALFSIPIVNDRRIYETTRQAVLSKKQKEDEAKRLLENIDDYLLAELGITLPKEPENNIKNRTFIRNLSDVSGGRLDPNYYQKIPFILSLNKKYKIEKLSSLLECPPQYGANEEATDFIPENSIRYIRITDIDEIGNLKDKGYKTAKKTEEKYLLKKDDLLFARSGSVGRCYIHKQTEQQAIFAGYLIRFIINKKEFCPDYIFFYCHSKIYKMWVDAIYRPAVQANINSEEYKSLPIILPPLPKQKEIAAHITQIRNEAKKLQEDAKNELEKAKAEIESMISGDGK